MSNKLKLIVIVMPMIPKRASLSILIRLSLGNIPLEGRKSRKVLSFAFLNFAAAGKLYSVRKVISYITIEAANV